MIRRMLEKMGIIEPRDATIHDVLTDAHEVNAEARREIHESRNRRAVLRLRMEHELRKARNHR